MATVTGLTAARMLAIEGASVVDGDIVGGHLILTKHDGTTIDAGSVAGPAGPMGPAGFSAIPGEIRMWSGATLPNATSYGHWVWADGAVYASATYPQAAANIATSWRTFAGASDPGGGNFRVPDMRGLVAAGLDAMPGGIRANRMTRSVAITIAARTGEEVHVITVPEIPAHSHAVNGSGNSDGSTSCTSPAGVPALTDHSPDKPMYGLSSDSVGGTVAHENVQPTVFIPYIVKLDG
jgi:microcystin-dependent protein